MSHIWKQARNDENDDFPIGHIFFSALLINYIQGITHRGKLQLNLKEFEYGGGIKWMIELLKDT
jgi:hypothetical protein